jgi:hypothetical protein
VLYTFRVPSDVRLLRARDDVRGRVGAVVACGVLWLAGCVCGPGQLLCGSQCTDVQSDPMNCGACGHRCDYLCSAGACVRRPECGPGAAVFDCDDHEACNGLEVCDAHTQLCQRGTAMQCSDGVSCTTDGCIAGECTHTPDDARCPDGESCDTTAGCSEVCVASPCDPVGDGCGCASSTACYADTLDVACEPEGARRLGEVCAGLTDCQAGMGCMLLSSLDLEGMCIAYCRTDGDCAGTHACLAHGGVTEAQPDLGICAPVCNLVTGVGCPSTAKCDFTDGSDGSTPISTCASPGGLGLGETCVNEEDCGRGLLCIRLATVTQCRFWCRIGRSDCPGGQRCLDIMPAVVLEGVSYGFCG